MFDSRCVIYWRRFIKNIIVNACWRVFLQKTNCIYFDTYAAFDILWLLYCMLVALFLAISYMTIDIKVNKSNCIHITLGGVISYPYSSKPTSKLRYEW